MSRFTSFLADAFTKIVQSDGTELPRRKKVNFVGCTIADNPTEERTDITPPGVGGGESNTNSNAGTGTGTLVKTKVGVDTPIKSLAKAAGDLITIANGTNEVTLSIPNVSIGTGDPDGSLAGAAGNVFIRTDSPNIYQNTDGGTTWVVVGSTETGTPYNVAPEVNTAAAGAAGSAAEYSRGDHRHQISVGSPVAVAAANADGVSTAVARADHAHAHGDQAGGSLHAVATPSASEVGGTAGFLSAIDKEKVDALEIDGDGLSFKANDGTYKVIEGGESGITTLTVWSPGITDAPPYYGTLATALAAVKSQPGPGVILMHPTTASAFATVASTTYDFDSRVSLYSINNRTLTFGDSAPLINPAEVGCLQDGFRLTLDDDASATGTRLLEVSSNLIRPHIYNLTKSGTARRLVQFTGGTASSERGITIGRNVTTAMAGDIYSDGKTAVTLRGHGHSFVAGVVENSSAHGNNLEVIYEDAQGETLTDLTSSWSTGAASNTFKAHAFRQSARTIGRQYNNIDLAVSGSGPAEWRKISGTWTNGALVNMSTGGFSNRLVNDGEAGEFRVHGSVTVVPSGGGPQDTYIKIRIAKNGGIGVDDSEREVPLSANSFGDYWSHSLSTETVVNLSTGDRVELQYWDFGGDTVPHRTIERMSLSAERIV